MDENKARSVLDSYIQKDDSLDGGWDWIEWDGLSTNAYLDGTFPVSVLEALVWWINNKIKEIPTNANDQ